MQIRNEEKLDIIWFARDADGYLVLAESRGGAIPSFALESAERTIRFAEQFCFLEAVTAERDLPLDVDKMTSVFGLTCYIAEEDSGAVYQVAGRSAGKRTRFSDLPGYLQELIPDNQLPFRAAETRSFRVSGSEVCDISPEEQPQQ